MAKKVSHSTAATTAKNEAKKMQAIITNPKLGEAKALLYSDILFEWRFAGAIPIWAGKLGIKAKLISDQSTRMILVDPAEKVADRSCWYAIQKLFVFSGDLPDWAQKIKAGQPPLWAQTVREGKIVPMPIEIAHISELAPDIRAHLIH